MKTLVQGAFILCNCSVSSDLPCSDLYRSILLCLRYGLIGYLHCVVRNPLDPVQDTNWLLIRIDLVSLQSFGGYET